MSKNVVMLLKEVNTVKKVNTKSVWGGYKVEARKKKQII